MAEMCEGTFETVRVKMHPKAPRLGAHLFCPECKSRVGVVVIEWPKEDDQEGLARINYHEWPEVTGAAASGVG